MHVSALMRKSTFCLLALTLLSLLGTDISHAAPSPISGAETFSRSDLSIGKHFPINLSRRYSSNTGYDSPLGYGWAHNFDKRLYTYADGSVIIRKETGWKRKFIPWSALSLPAKCAIDGGIWIQSVNRICFDTIENCKRSLTFPDICKDSSGNTIFTSFDTISPSGPYGSPVGETGILVKNTDGTFTYTEKDGSSELYDLKGRLVTIAAPSGSSLSLTYIAPTRSSLIGLLPTNIDQNTPLEVARDYLLLKIEEKNPAGALTGTSLTFNYNSGTGRLTGIADNLGRAVAYSHDTIGNLTGVTTSLLSSTYGYTDSNNKHLVTTLDEGDGPYVNTFDKSGRVTRQTHANGIIDIEYTIPRKKTKVTTTIKDENSTTLNTSVRILEFDSQGQKTRETDTIGNESRYSRDDNMNITREEKWENTGTIATPVLFLKTATNSTYDTRNNLLTKTEALGTPLEKTTTWTYDPTFNRILTQTEKSVVNPAINKVTTNIYDGKGNLTSSTTTGLLGDATPFTYTTTYTYDTNSKLKTIDGPRTDVTDITTNNFDTAGILTSVTPPLSGTTTYSNFDSLGNPQTATDPNGAVTTYTYDTNGRVLTVKAPGDTQTTQYTYTTSGCGGCGGAVNKIKTIILPEGNRIDYFYDANGNQSRIVDNVGNSINYSYDSEGNKLKEEIKDLAGTLQKTLRYQYDALNRLTKVINPDNTFTLFGYDSRNNRTSSADPKLNSTSYQYDALNRLTATIQPGSITTGFGYDANSNQTSVSDPNTNTTTYKFDDAGRVYQTISPDTGTTTYTYDPAGNLKTKMDAKGVTTSYGYDATNRLTSISYPNTADNVGYAYDTCVNGKGRLCTLTDTSGTTSYEYSPKGQFSKETKVIDGLTYVTQYTYDMNGNIKTMTYPSGRVITYTYADNKTISVQNNAANLATNITYKPFGGITGLTYGNAIAGTTTYDNQYRIAGIIAGTVMNLTYTDDANGNITAIANTLDSTKSKAFTYDAIDRLATATSTGIWGSLAWTYDGTGNRKTEGANSYTYQANSNKLTSANGKTFGYDNNGNTTTENARQYTYNQNQRLTQVVDGTMTAGYTYNGNGQRVKKVVNGTTTVFHYSQSGQIIAESNSAGATTAEYVYLNGQPLAKIEDANTYYYHNDHLGTPQKLTNSAGTVVWSADYKPFGEATIVSTVTNNLRFPGQYYDAETGLHYNYFRDYNAAIGRYVESDPVGLKGGLNPFVYAKNNAMKFIDSNGLKCTQSPWVRSTVFEDPNSRGSLISSKSITKWQKVSEWNILPLPDFKSGKTLNLFCACKWTSNGSQNINIYRKNELYEATQVCCQDNICHNNCTTSTIYSDQPVDKTYIEDQDSLSNSLNTEITFGSYTRPGKCSCSQPSY